MRSAEFLLSSSTFTKGGKAITAHDLKPLLRSQEYRPNIRVKSPHKSLLSLAKAWDCT